MKFVENWRAAPKWISMQLIALAAIWEGLPIEARAVIPMEWQSWITLALLVGAGFGRLIDQGTAAPVRPKK